MYQELKFRRQFLLGKTPINQLEHWNCVKIDRYYLYTHPDLEVTRVDDSVKSIVLIGSMFDPAQPEKNNTDIVKDVQGDIGNLEDLFSRVKPYAGSYVLLYKDDKNTIIVQDALSLREVYYCTEENLIVCGSQPNLIAECSEPAIEARSEPEFLEFYAKHSTNSRWNHTCEWIGDETYYEGVKHLLPNHFLDIGKREVHRYWPNAPIKRLDLEEAVERSCSFLQGSIRAIAHRHPVMMAVTSGVDSRTLLAASREIKDKIYYFVNNQNLGYSHPDISVPRKIFEGIGVPFHVHDVPEDVDAEFRQIFLGNTFFASERILPTIYNVYFKGHSEKINALGIGEIGRTRYGKEPRNLNSYRMIYQLGYRREGRYAIREAEKSLAELLPVGRAYGLNVLTLFYWEQALGNWGPVGNSESDIAIEELNPFDSHLLYELFLGVDDKYTKVKNNILFNEMIRNMWPELLEWPFNPPYMMRNTVRHFLDRVAVLGLLKELKYRVKYFRHLKESRKNERESAAKI